MPLRKRNCQLTQIGEMKTEGSFVLVFVDGCIEAVCQDVSF